MDLNIYMYIFIYIRIRIRIYPLSSSCTLWVKFPHSKLSFSSFFLILIRSKIKRGDQIKGSKKGEKECGDLTQRAEEEDGGLCIYICIYVYINTYIQPPYPRRIGGLYIYMHTYVRMSTHKYIYIYIHIYILRSIE
jgi:hypothetical protein